MCETGWGAGGASATVECDVGRLAAAPLSCYDPCVMPRLCTLALRGTHAPLIRVVVRKTQRCRVASNSRDNTPTALTRDTPHTRGTLFLLPTG